CVFVCAPPKVTQRWRYNPAPRQERMMNTALKLAKPEITPQSPVFGYLNAEELEQFGAEIDAVRQRILSSLDEGDAAYIRRIIRWQRGLEVLGRGALFLGILPPFWLLGTASLSVAKILENMEIGHNVMHGQWDWMRDPSIHSSTWEWDNVCPKEEWKHSHNFMHHKWTNVVGMDRDVGYGILRMSEEQPWHPAYLFQPITNALLASFFQW